ncbi:LysR family transcriptional regulator [Pseudomonas sp. BAY1663]|nr:LysR family transcriptional regulator [Pseudomonas sp. BAY1663]
MCWRKEYLKLSLSERTIPSGEDRVWGPGNGRYLVPMEQQEQVRQRHDSQAFAMESLVRVAIAEPLLHDIVNRDLIAYLRANRQARVELLPLDNPFNPQPEDAHILVWLRWPESVLPRMYRSDFTMRPLGTLEYVPCVAKRYARGRAHRSDRTILEKFMLVQLQDYATVPSLAPWNRVVNQRRAGVTTLRSYGTMRELVRWGACLGLMPYYVPRLDRNLLALPDLLPGTMEVQAWLAVSPDASCRPDVSAIADMILCAFNERRGLF